MYHVDRIRTDGPSAGDIEWDENLVAHEKWCNDLAVKFLCIFVLDRFGDFVSDQVNHTYHRNATSTHVVLQ